MSSLRMRTTFGFLLLDLGVAMAVVRAGVSGLSAGSGDALAARAVEQVRVFRREGDEDRVALAQRRRPVGLDLDEALVDDDGDDRAVAEVLDALDARAQPAVGEAQVAGSYA